MNTQMVEITSLLTDEQREVFDKLLVTRYEEALRKLQSARRDRNNAELNVEEANEELHLIRYMINIAEKYFKAGDRQGQEAK